MSHNARLTKTGDSSRERRHASSRARRRQPFLLCGGAGWQATTLRFSWVGGGSRKIPRAEQRRRRSYRSLGSILCFLGLSLGRVVWAIEPVGKMGLRPP